VRGDGHRRTGHGVGLTIVRRLSDRFGWPIEITDMSHTPTRKIFLTLSVLSLLSACRTAHPPLTTEAQVDLDRFMGDWYVIANIPTSIERGAHNAVESYALDADGSIGTTFTFRDGAFDGEVKRYCPRGFVGDDSSKAIWRMQFIWPIKADYRIVHVSPDYQRTIVGREKRDYVWIMARSAQIADAELKDLMDRVAREGYDLSRVERVPQQWPEGANAPPRAAVEECAPRTRK
jgi:apolipoprotein D and lipocalin family protein